MLEANAVAGTGKADEGGSRERVLTSNEIVKIWTTMVSGQHVDFVDVVRLLLLTAAARRNRSLRWSEVDFDAKLLCLPPERTKNKREHLVPLSSPRWKFFGFALANVMLKGRGTMAGYSVDFRGAMKRRGSTLALRSRLGDCTIFDAPLRRCWRTSLGFCRMSSRPC